MKEEVYQLWLAHALFDALPSSIGQDTGVLLKESVSLISELPKERARFSIWLIFKVDWHLFKAGQGAEVVANGVFPALWCCPKIREMLSSKIVDLLHIEATGRAAF
jgi:hypothetical protein